MRHIFAGVILAVLSMTAHTTELTILSAGAMQPGIEKVITQFEKNTQHHVKVQFGTGPQLAERLSSGQLADIFVAPNGLLEDQIKKNIVQNDTKVYIGKVGVGVTVRNSLANPNMSNVESLKDNLLRAQSIVYNKASTGIYIEKLIEKLGIAAELKDKTTRYDNGEKVLLHVIGGKGNEIGLAAITEIKLYEDKGLKLVGPLPTEVQNYTSYSAGLMNVKDQTQVSAAVAKEFMEYLKSKSSQALIKSVGIE
ncbi:MAG: substrate-binding domain-containing protein [Betaproteobacteria bacterium]